MSSVAASSVRPAASPWPSGPAPRLAGLVAAWPEPAALLAPDGTVVEANDAAAPVLDALAMREGGVPGAAAEGTGRFHLQVAAPAGPVVFDVTLVACGAGVFMSARDVSLAANLRAALAESRTRFKELVEISSDLAWETDANGAFVYVTPGGGLGFAPDELVGRPAGILALPDDGGALLPFRTSVRVAECPVWLRRKDGAAIRASVSAAPLFAPDGTHKGARGICRDITALHEHETRLAEARNRERLLVHLARTIRDVVAPADMLSAAASAAGRALGATGAAIWCGAAAASPAGLWGEMPQADGAGEGAAIEAATLYRGVANGRIVLWRADAGRPWTADDRDILGEVADQLAIANAQIAQHEALSRMARTDALTGLLNRGTFRAELASRLAAGASGALVYVDLDNFKQVNDRFGHERGDETLRLIAGWLAQAAEPADLAARLGGDEFALWLAGTDAARLRARAERLLAHNRALARAFVGMSPPPGLSIGLAVRAPGESDDALVARADDAMYRAKRGGKGRLSIAPGGQAGT